MFAIASSRVVTPSGEIPAAVVIEKEMIREVVPRSELPLDVTVVDVGDLVVSPGIVDAHVHINEPGRSEWEGFESATHAAAAGGITTIIDMPLNSSPVTTNADALYVKQAAAAGKCAVDVGFYGGLIPGNDREIDGLVKDGVFGIKAFLCDSGLDEFPASKESDLTAALNALKGTNVPLLAHAEIVGNKIKVADPCSSIDYAHSRPESYEIKAIELLIRLARQFATPIHLVHLASAAALPLISAAKAEGLPITVETCPHYLYFDLSQIKDGQTSFKCAPPIRDQTNRDLLRDAVKSGLIETIGSDHSPCPPDLKATESGDFTKAWGGIASLQLSLSVMWTIAKQSGWNRAMLAERLSSRPAEIFGLSSRKGKIAPGYHADLVVWDPSASYQVNGKLLAHRHPLTPYEGRKLNGKVERTYLRGKLIYAQNELQGELQGNLIHRDAACDLAKYLNQLDEARLFQTLETCCASQTWIRHMTSAGQFQHDEDVLKRSENACSLLLQADWLQAFSAHPRIGEMDSLRKKYANTRSVAGDEQVGVRAANQQVLNRLASANEEYFEKFGFIFIVCATGKSAAEMLELLEHRLLLSRAEEISNAADEQLKITSLRLRKLIK